MKCDTVVRGGMVANADATFRGDIGIVDGRIAALGADLEADGVIDCSGCIVVPGAIDVHTHFETCLDVAYTADDYESGSRAAAFGGVTTYVNYAFQESGRSLVHAIDREQTLAAGHSHVDFGFHVVVTDPRDEVLAQFATLTERQVTSIKLFMAVPGLERTDREMLAVLAAAADAGLLVNVHAEDGAIIDHLTRRLRTEGGRGIEALPEARPVISEALAVEKLAAFAQVTGCPVYIVHLSCQAALEVVARTRTAGAPLFVETRPVYLFLDESRYRLAEPDARQFSCWPPLRSPADRDALWTGLANGVIQTYATDHTTHMIAAKADPSLDFAQVPGGMSNVQTSIGMLYAEGVAAGRLSLGRFVAATATNPAKLFGMWPRKGTIAVGADADLVVIDPARQMDIKTDEMQSNSDFEPFDGLRLTGWPVMTISRGRVIVKENELLGDRSHGRLVPRESWGL